jgi:RpiR family carbohydrate utilization transcriptional regulator
MTKYLSVVPRSTGDPLLRIRTDLGKYSAAHRQVGKVFLDAPDRAIRASVEEIARLANVSAPTVIRFCRALGFDGFSDFKLRLAQSLAAGTPFLHRAINPDEAVPGILHKILSAPPRCSPIRSELDAGAMKPRPQDRGGTAHRCYGVGATSTFLANNAQARSRLGCLERVLRRAPATDLGGSADRR